METNYFLCACIEISWYYISWYIKVYLRWFDIKLEKSNRCKGFDNILMVLRVEKEMKRWYIILSKNCINYWIHKCNVFKECFGSVDGESDYSLRALRTNRPIIGVLRALFRKSGIICRHNFSTSLYSTW